MNKIIYFFIQNCNNGPFRKNDEANKKENLLKIYLFSLSNKLTIFLIFSSEREFSGSRFPLVQDSCHLLTF